MYRKLILGILLAVASSATYYVVFSGGANVITNAVRNDVTPSYNTPTVEMMSGIYSCTKLQGCLATTTLTLKDDNTAEMVSSVAESSVVGGGVESGESKVGEQPTQETEVNSYATITEDSSGLPLAGTVLLERGSWELGTNNILIVTLTESGTSTYERYHKFIAQNVSTSTIQKITFPKDLFPSLVKPVFIRLEY